MRPLTKRLPRNERSRVAPPLLTRVPQLPIYFVHLEDAVFDRTSVYTVRCTTQFSTFARFAAGCTSTPISSLQGLGKAVACACPLVSLSFAEVTKTSTGWSFFFSFRPLKLCLATEGLCQLYLWKERKRRGRRKGGEKKKVRKRRDSFFVWKCKLTTRGRVVTVVN